MTSTADLDPADRFDAAVVAQWGRGYAPPRRHLPWLLVDMWPQLLATDPAAARYGVAAAWSAVDSPISALPMDQWAEMVRAAVPPCEHLTTAETLTLYRGVQDEAHAAGACWTGDLHTARLFADRVRGVCAGIVYRATVPTSEVLAHLCGDLDSRGEDEYIVTPAAVAAALTIHEDRRGGDLPPSNPWAAAVTA